MNLELKCFALQPVLQHTSNYCTLPVFFLVRYDLRYSVTQYEHLIYFIQIYLSNFVTMFYLKQESNFANNVVVYFIIFEFPGKGEKTEKLTEFCSAQINTINM